MPYVVKEARRLAEVALDIPNPPPEFRETLNDLLLVMHHPLAVKEIEITDVYHVEKGR